MIRKLAGFVVLGTALLLLVAAVFKSKLLPPSVGEGFLASPAAVCGNDIDVVATIEKLSLEGPDADRAYDTLLQNANEAPACRREVVDALIQSLKRPPHRNFVVDRSGFTRWSYGSALLGELKAVETLDLLIDHLNLNDGHFSASMAHSPVVRAVEAMGTLAVPKLTLALQHNPNRDIRLYAALCLSDTGEPVAVDALKQALNSESDECIRRFIELSIETSPDPKLPKSSPPLSSADADLIRQKLFALKCDN